MPMGEPRAPLALENYQTERKPKARFLLSCSDGHPMKMSDVLAMADDECKALWEDLTLCYGQSLGHPLLRQEAARVHGMKPEDVLVNVPQGAIYVALNVLIPYLTRKSGLDKIHVISCCPVYGVINALSRSMQCDISYWMGRFHDQGWTFDIDELKALVKENTRLLIFNFPQNPTGFCPTEKEYRDLIEFCKSKHIFIFSDEMYMFTNNGDLPNLPSACTLYEDSITLFGMSKTLAQPGLCIGWMVSKNHEVMKLMIDYKEYISNCSSGPAEILSIITLRNLDKILKRNMAIIHKNLDLLDEFFSDYKDVFEWHRPRGGTVTLVKVKGWAAQLGGGGASGLCDSLLDENGVMLAPGKLFEVKDDFIRIGFGRSDLAEGLVPLRSFLDKHKPQS